MASSTETLLTMNSSSLIGLIAFQVGAAFNQFERGSERASSAVSSSALRFLSGHRLVQVWMALLRDGMIRVSFVRASWTDFEVRSLMTSQARSGALAVLAT